MKNNLTSMPDCNVIKSKI